MLYPYITNSYSKYFRIFIGGSKSLIDEAQIVLLSNNIHRPYGLYTNCWALNIGVVLADPASLHSYNTDDYKYQVKQLLLC